MLLHILSVIAPVFICALIGFAWVKRGHQFETAFVSTLVTNIAAPCLIFSTFMEIEIDMDAFTSMAGAATVCTILFGLIGFAVLYCFKLDQRTYLPSQLIPNVGNMGLPLCLLAFGEAGLALGLTYFMVNIVFGFVVGMGISSGSFSVKELLRNPMFQAVVVTLATMFLNLSPPNWLLNTTGMLGDLTIPLMLIALGVSLGSFKISSIKRSVALAVLRLVMGFSVGIVVAFIFNLDNVAKGILIMQSAMPIAVFSYLFAVRYQRSPEDVAGTVVISTLLSFITLPLLLWFVLPTA